MTFDPSRPGLPQPAARRAARWDEELPYNEALLDARAATPLVDQGTLEVLRLRLVPPTAVETEALIAEIERLRAAEADRIVLLERLAYEEAARYDHDLKYPLRRLDDDCYLPWSGSCDSPVTYGSLTRTEALARGWTQAHLDRADARDAEDADRVLYNRAGPEERCLTRAALKEAYASGEAHAAFRLTPDKIAPYTSSGREDPVTGEWDDKTVYWVPWHPDETPETLPNDWDDRF